MSQDEPYEDEAPENTSIIDFGKESERKIENKRRRYERVLFNRLLGTFTYVESVGLIEASVVNVSKEGVGFRMSADKGAFNIGEVLKFRFYFTQNEYISCEITVKYVQNTVVDGVDYFQFGAEFNKSLKSFEAMSDFIQFIYSFAKFSKRDEGERRSSYLW